MYTVEYRDHAKHERVLFETDELIVADIVRGDAETNPYRELISTNF